MERHTLAHYTITPKSVPIPLWNPFYPPWTLPPPPALSSAIADLHFVTVLYIELPATFHKWTHKVYTASLAQHDYFQIHSQVKIYQ